MTEIMNRKIGMYSSLVNLISIVCFALSMLLELDYLSYFSSMFIALSFIPIICSYTYFAGRNVKIAGYVAICFSIIYATIILLVYFAQLTTVRLNELTEQASTLLDFQKYGLLFNFDLLGYAMMSLATFFTGLTIRPKTKQEAILKILLLIHGLFFISCFFVPMLGLFKSENPKWIGVLILEIWCLYFCPISILSTLYFSRFKI